MVNEKLYAVSGLLNKLQFLAFCFLEKQFAFYDTELSLIKTFYTVKHFTGISKTFEFASSKKVLYLRWNESYLSPNFGTLLTQL